MLIPIGYDSPVTFRLPVVTFLIVIINFYVGFFVYPKMNAEQQAFNEQAYHELMVDTNADSMKQSETGSKPKDTPSSDAQKSKETGSLDNLNNLGTVKEAQKLLQKKDLYQENLDKVNKQIDQEMQNLFLNKPKTDKNITAPITELPDQQAIKEELESRQKELNEARQKLAINVWGFLPTHITFQGLISHMFIHNNWLNMIFNMLFFTLGAMLLEHIWGRTIFTLFFLFSGFAGALGFYLENMHGTEPLLGAYGAVAGIMGAFLVTHPKMPIKFLMFLLYPVIFSLKAYIVLPLWFVIQIFFASMGDTSIAYSANIAGFLFGVIGAFILRQTNIEQNIKEKYNYSLEDPHEEMFKNAKVKYSLKKKDDAEEILNKILQENPEHLDALVFRGDLHLEKVNLELAVKDWQNAVEFAAKKRKKKTVSDAYLKIFQTATPVEFTTPTTLFLAQTLIESPYKDMGGRLFDQVWEKDRAGIPFRQLISYAEYLTDISRTREKALEVISCIKSHLDYRIEFEEEISLIQERAEKLEPAELEDENLPEASQTVENETLSYKPAESPTQTTIDASDLELDDHQSVAQPSGQDLDFGFIDLPKQVEKQTLTLNDGIIVKMNQTEIGLKVNQKMTQYKWSDIRALALSRLNNKLILDLITHKSSTMIEGIRISELKQVIPPNMNTTPDKLIAHVAKTAFQYGVPWLFMSDAKPVIRTFNTPEDLKKVIIELLEK